MAIDDRKQEKPAGVNRRGLGEDWRRIALLDCRLDRFNDRRLRSRANRRLALS
jgi:hypothetical protein